MHIFTVFDNSMTCPNAKLPARRPSEKLHIEVVRNVNDIVGKKESNKQIVYRQKVNY